MKNGTKYPFKEINVKINVAMEEDQLYLLYKDQRKPIKILPIILLSGYPEEEKNAIYFYNRCDGEKIRLISYHYEKLGEIISMDDVLLEVIHKYLTPYGIDE